MPCPSKYSTQPPRSSIVALCYTNLLQSRVKCSIGIQLASESERTHSALAAGCAAWARIVMQHVSIGRSSVLVHLTAATCKALVLSVLGLAQARTAICTRCLRRFRVPKPTVLARPPAIRPRHVEVGQVNISKKDVETRHQKDRTCKRSTRCVSSPDNKSYRERCMISPKSGIPVWKVRWAPSQRRACKAPPCLHLIHHTRVRQPSGWSRSACSSTRSLTDQKALRIGMCSE